jgi:hypothetical protein
MSGTKAIHNEEKQQPQQEIRHGRGSSATLVPEMLAALSKMVKIEDTIHVQEYNERDEITNNLNPLPKYLTGRSLVLVTIGFLLGDFVASLDQSMVATALPKLASEFKALDQLTWVVSAFFCESSLSSLRSFHLLHRVRLTLCDKVTEAGAMLTLGQILTVAPSKWVFTACFILFKIASLICALAPKLEVLIFGRGLQGVHPTFLLSHGLNNHFRSRSQRWITFRRHHDLSGRSSGSTSNSIWIICCCSGRI